MIARLVGGPEATLPYVASLPLEPPFDRESADQAWVLRDSYQGGALIDQNRRELVWFCGDTDHFFPSHLPRRRLVFRLLGHVWEGWRVRWAYRGMEELAEHVGPFLRVDQVDDDIVALGPDAHVIVNAHWMWRDENPLREPDGEDLAEIRFGDGEDLELNRTGQYRLLTVRGPGGSTRAWALDRNQSGGAHLAWNGPGLLDRLPHEGWDSARLAIPIQGLHVDVGSRSIGLWTTMWVADLFTEAERLWPGWRVHFWADDYESHVEAAGDTVRLAGCDEGALVVRWRGMLDEYARTMDVSRLAPRAADRVRRGLDTAIADVRRDLNLT